MKQFAQQRKSLQNKCQKYLEIMKMRKITCHLYLFKVIFKNHYWHESYSRIPIHLRHLTWDEVAVVAISFFHIHTPFIWASELEYRRYFHYSVILWFIPKVTNRLKVYVTSLHFLLFNLCCRLLAVQWEATDYFVKVWPLQTGSK